MPVSDKLSLFLPLLASLLNTTSGEVIINSISSHNIHNRNNSCHLDNYHHHDQGDGYQVTVEDHDNHDNHQSHHLS